MAKNFRDFFVVLQAKDEVQGEPPCSNCSLPDEKGTVRCFDCKEYFCDSCHTSHGTLKSMKMHKVISLKELRSGNVLPPLTTTGDEICNDHDGEKKKFYCETCERPICRDCIVLDHRQHECISLKKASKSQLAKLRDLTSKCESSKNRYTDAIKKTEGVEKNLVTASQEIKKKLQQIKSEYQRHLGTIFKQHETDAASVMVQRAKELGDIKEDFQTKLGKAENACELVSKVEQTGSNYDITSIYSILSANLEEVTVTTEPKDVDGNLGIIAVTTNDKIQIPDVVSVMKGETWEQLGTSPLF